jgi:hypothetical protein
MLHGYHVEDGLALFINQNVYVNVTYSKNQNVHMNATWLSCRRWTGIIALYQNVYVNDTYSKNQNVYVNVTWLSCRRWTGIIYISKCLCECYI